MKLFSTLLLTLAVVGAAATSSTPKVVRTANKGVESSRQLSEQGVDNNSPTPATINRPNGYPTPSYTSYGYGYSSGSSGHSSGGSKPSPSKPHKKKPAAKKTKSPKKPKATPHKPSSSSHSSSSGHSSSYSSYKPYGYKTTSTTTYYSAVGALALVGAAATVLAKKQQRCCFSESNGDEDPTIDTNDVLEGDYINETASVEMPESDQSIVV